MHPKAGCLRTQHPLGWVPNGLCDYVPCIRAVQTIRNGACPTILGWTVRTLGIIYSVPERTPASFTVVNGALQATSEESRTLKISFYHIAIVMITFS